MAKSRLRMGGRAVGAEGQCQGNEPLCFVVLSGAERVTLAADVSLSFSALFDFGKTNVTTAWCHTC